MLRLSQLRPVLAAMPKVDLHRHLEGSLRLETLVEIAREHGLDLPSWDPEELRPYVQIVDDPPDFHGFLAKFRLLRRFYSNREAVTRLAYEAVVDAANDNVKYLELRFNPVALSAVQGFDYAEVTEWVIEATHRAESEHDIRVRLIVQIGRDESLSVARRVAEVAVAYQSGGIVGLDLAGDEVSHPAARFADIFRWAKGQGLHITVHAGEAGPADNVRQAVERLGAERIGHGVRAGDDPELLQLLTQRAVTLEMCPTSNLQTGVVVALSRHPLCDYHQAGVRVTINTDDPSISNTTLTDEYAVALHAMGVTLPSLRRMIINAARAAFLPDPERQQLVDWFEQALPNYEAHPGASQIFA